MPDSTGLIEQIVLPFEQAILAVARGVAEAQKALDQSSMDIQKAIEADPELSRLGLTASWFQMPEIELELKMSLSIHESGPTPKKQLGVALFNAAYQNRFDYSMSGTSSLKLKIRPVPPPLTLTVLRAVPQVVGMNRASAEQALTDAGLAVGNVTSQPSDKPTDTVVAQAPIADSQSPPDTRVDLVVSSGTG